MPFIYRQTLDFVKQAINRQETLLEITLYYYQITTTKCSESDIWLLESSSLDLTWKLIRMR